VLPNVLVNDHWERAAENIPSPNVLTSILDFINKTLIIAELETRKIRHDPTEILTRAVQPALWLLVFGQVFAARNIIPTGNGSNYLDFLAPGILAQSVLFISIFSGITLIWERDLGIIHKFLASPIARASLVTGKALAAGVKALAQGIIIYILAFVLSVHVDWNPLALAGTLIVVVMGAMLFSTFSLIIACLVKTRERFMGIGQLMTLPLFFASNAIYPVSIMPDWLRPIAQINPCPIRSICCAP
jgi:ABC-2 type transport system permease protein